jgi:hypothetical protein
MVDKNYPLATYGSPSFATQMGRVDTETHSRQEGRIETMSPENNETFSAGETGEATEDSSTTADVIIGEIPAAEDPSVMVWTARCTDARHDLLDHFETRSEAETAGAQHLASEHSRTT